MEKKKSPAAFIRNTYQILQKKQHQNIISWAEDGQGFIIKSIQKFQLQILPQYFKHKKYTSFVRQLNMYGFHKMRHGNNENYFKHQDFKRGHIQLNNIKRKPQKKKGNQPDSQEAKLEQSQSCYHLNQSISQKALQYYDFQEITLMSQLLIQQNKMLLSLNENLRQEALNSKARKIQIFKRKLQDLQRAKNLTNNQSQINRDLKLIQISNMQAMDNHVCAQLISILKSQFIKVGNLIDRANQI